MVDKCDPCQCPELYYRNITAWRKGVLKLLCTILEAIRNFPGGGGIDCVNTATVAEGVPVMCTSTGAAPLACGDLGDVLTVTGTDPCTAAWQPPGGAASAFEWSTSEQVWPFEKDVGGGTIYAKLIDLGQFPNSGTKLVAHGVAGFTSDKLRRIEGYMYPPGFPNSQAAPIPATFGLNDVQVNTDNTNIYIITVSDWTAYNGVIRFYYVK